MPLLPRFLKLLWTPHQRRPAFRKRRETGGKSPWTRLHAQFEALEERLVLSTGFPVQIVDDGDAGFTASAGWINSPLATDVGGSAHLSPAGTGQNVATWTINGLTPGQYQVSATWQRSLSEALNSPFTIWDGSNLVDKQLVNQQLAPSDFSDGGVSWQNLGGAQTVFGTSLRIQLSNQASGYVAADAIRIERLGDLPTGPQVSVVTDSGLISPQSVVPFNNSVYVGTFIGSPVTKTFSVRDVGADELDLDGTIQLPAGFSLISGFGATVLQPGEATTFIVQLDAASAGNYGGILSFGTNAVDVPLFSLTLSGDVSSGTIVNDADSGFSTIGDWTYSTQEGAFGPNVHYSYLGGGENTATWNVTGLLPGEYRVSTTWPAAGNRATDAPFTITADGTVLGEIQLNQRLGPDDFTDAGAAWENLGGILTIFGSSLSIQVSNAADGYVMADAIRIERVGNVPQAGRVAILSNNNAIDGTGTLSFQSDLFPGTFIGGPIDTVFTVRNQGAGTLNLAGPIQLPAGFSLVAGFGKTTLSAGEFTTFTVQLDATAAGNYTGTLSFGTDDPLTPIFTVSVAGTVYPTVQSMIDVQAPADVARIRDNLIDFFWGPAGFPIFDTPQSVETNVSSPVAGISNLQSVDRIQIDMDLGFTSIAYLFHPVNSNNHLVLFHQGHSPDLNGTGGDLAIQFLVANGFTVLAFQMPLLGENTGPIASMWDMGSLATPTLNPMQFYLEPIAIGLNFVLKKNNFDSDIAMTGISGGGWETTLYAAIDPRIKVSIPVAGSEPSYITPMNSYEGDNPGTYAIANYLDLYVLGAYGAGREQIQILNKFDPQAFSGDAWQTYAQVVTDTVANLGEGSYSFFSDDTSNQHWISPTALNQVVIHALAPDTIGLSANTVAENKSLGTVIGALSSTGPNAANNTYTYSLISGPGSDDNAEFSTVNETLTTAAAFDFETRKLYSIRVRATDQFGLISEAVFSITIADADDPPTELSLSNNSLAENSPIGTLVGKLGSKDQDPGDTATYTLIAGKGGEDNRSFSLKNGILQTAAVLDYDTQSTYSIRVRVTDAGGLSLEKVFTITLTNVNEAPTAISLTNSSVPENSPIGTAVGTLKSIDPDAGDSATYALVAGPGSDDNALFSISHGSLQTGAVFDYETRTAYSVRVRVTDAGGLFFEKALTINVTNVNERPRDITLSNNTLAENSPIGTTVGNFSSLDPDAGDTATFTLVAGKGANDNRSFSINNGILQTNAVLNYEAQPTYSILVRVNDAGGLAFEKVFTINLTNVNETPTDLSLSNNRVAENSPVGTAIGRFGRVDPDTGDSATFSLVQGPGSEGNSAFTMDNGVLRTGSVVDYETQPAYSIRVRITDAGGLSFEKVLPISVTNVNETPADFSLSNNSVAEISSVGTVVGTFGTIDPDAGDTATYTLVSGTGSEGNRWFTVQNGVLQTGVVFDYETQPAYNIRVRVTDAGGLSVEKVFTINLTNVNEAPTNITLSNNNVAENNPAGTPIGTFGTIDPDAADTATYTLGAGTGSDDNSAFTIDNGVLHTGASFDFETQPVYSIRVRVTDGGGLSFEKVFTINVTNVNEAPREISLSNNNVAENSPAGTAVGTIASLDPDAGDSATYTLVTGTGSDGNSAFSIDNHGVLRTAGNFDYETQPVYSIQVRVIDAGGVSFEKVFAITVANVNEAPTDLSLSKDNVAENSPAGAAVGMLLSLDPDAGDSAVYALVAGAGSEGNSAFVIDNGTLRTGVVFDYETQPAYNIRVGVTDAGGLSFEKVLTIRVTNVNEAPTSITLSANSVTNDIPVGTVVAQLSSVDPDSGNSFNYTLVPGTGSGNNSLFAIQGNTLVTNALLNSTSLASLGVRVRSTDQEGLIVETIQNLTLNKIPALDLNGNLAGRDYSVAYPGKGKSVAIEGASAVVSNLNKTTLTSLKVTITNPLDAASEKLAATTKGTKIVASYSSRTGVLTLTGTDSLAHYQQVLRTIKYVNSAAVPHLQDRSITFVTNDGVSDSTVATATLLMSPTTNPASAASSNPRKNK